jgi:hypothetical protein
MRRCPDAAHARSRPCSRAYKKNDPSPHRAEERYNRPPVDSRNRLRVTQSDGLLIRIVGILSVSDGMLPRRYSSWGEYLISFICVPLPRWHVGIRPDLFLKCRDCRGAAGPRSLCSIRSGLKPSTPIIGHIIRQADILRCSVWRAELALGRRPGAAVARQTGAFPCVRCMPITKRLQSHTCSPFHPAWLANKLRKSQHKIGSL